MEQLPPQDPVAAALQSSHRPFALACGPALRYPAGVAPFAAVLQPGTEALEGLRDSMHTGEALHLIAETLPPLPPGLRSEGSIPCLQLVFPPGTALSEPSMAGLLPLTCAEAGEMEALIQVAYPGYFRVRTCQMGRYFGLRDGSGQLIAMGGERLVSEPWREISGLCVLPGQAGKGLGTEILLHLLRLHRAEGSRSWLWVTERNGRALALYQRLGFTLCRRSPLQVLRREIA